MLLTLGAVTLTGVTAAEHSAEVRASRGEMLKEGAAHLRTGSGWSNGRSGSDLDQVAAPSLRSAAASLVSSSDPTGRIVKYAHLSGTDWESEPVAVCSGDASLGLDASGTPHIGYTHCGPEVRRAVLSDTTWLSETVNGAAMRPSLVLDSSGNPHLAYPDLQPLPPGGAGQGIKYAYWTGSVWVKQGVDAVKSNQVPSLALDSSDVPHVAYYDEGNDSLKYAVLSGTVWISQTVDAFAGDPSLVLDSFDVPHIAYTQSGPQVGYAVLSGTTWLTQTVEGAAIRPSLALDSSDNPRLSYCSFLPPAIGGGLKYAFSTGSGWVKTRADAIACDSPSLGLDGSDTPHIAYHDSSGNSVKYAVLSDTTWINETVDEYALDPSLAIDSLGDPHVAYTHVEYRTYVPLCLMRR